MENKYQEDLVHIRSMMERSSRFISLSGLSGVGAGVTALLGAAFAYYLLHENGVAYMHRNAYSSTLFGELVVTGMVVLIIALLFGIYFTVRKSKRNNLQIWTTTTKSLLLHLAIPLLAGGIFCAALMAHGAFMFVSSATLVFYGLALINASKYTFRDVFYLGILETVLGLISMFLPGYGLLFWATGFGILHIVYGILMQKKYN
jgi:predicted lysophospholipase L1 biosynthesis ABC-type transport system permease subunit